jgi:hypothetical protein
MEHYRSSEDLDGSESGKKIRNHLFFVAPSKKWKSSRDADPHHFNSDPDSAFRCYAKPDQTFPLKRIRILLLIKVMRICDYWREDPLKLRSKNLKLYFEPPRLQV